MRSQHAILPCIAPTSRRRSRLQSQLTAWRMCFAKWHLRKLRPKLQQDIALRSCYQFTHLQAAWLLAAGVGLSRQQADFVDQRRLCAAICRQHGRPRARNQGASTFHLCLCTCARGQLACRCSEVLAPCPCACPRGVAASGPLRFGPCARSRTSCCTCKCPTRIAMAVAHLRSGQHDT